MAINESLCFVQFMHPGREAKPERGASAIGWNDGPSHARKYLRCPGTYLDGGNSVCGELEFWGEWEPESVVVEEWGRQPNDGPQRVWRPYYQPRDNYAGLQNTDPFVFGSFLYTGCKQYTHHGTRATQLRYLKRGSVLLFGSCIGGAFALDTVFVVKEWIDHNAANYRELLRGRVPEAYWDVTLFPWHGEGNCGRVQDRGCQLPVVCAAPDSGDGGVRLYFGATYGDEVEGMFSFVPGQPAGRTKSGFARPAIELPGIIKPSNRQANKLNRQGNLSDVVKLWHKVKAQVQGSGLALGVSVDVPPRR